MLCGGAGRIFRIVGRFGLGVDQSHWLCLWRGHHSTGVGEKRRSPPGSGLQFSIPASVLPSKGFGCQLCDSSFAGDDSELSRARHVDVGALLGWLLRVGLFGVEVGVVFLVGPR